MKNKIRAWLKDEISDYMVEDWLIKEFDRKFMDDEETKPKCKKCGCELEYYEKDADYCLPCFDTLKRKKEV